MTLLDLGIIAAYLALIAGIGLYLARDQRTTETYFIAARTIPGWAVAFTIMATIVGSGTFIGHPGTAYQKGLILFLPTALTLPVVLWAVAKYIVPFYRRVVRMSAYEYIGLRFGLAGRLYTSIGFLADRIFDLGGTIITTALAMSVLTGWPIQTVIWSVGLFTIAYTMAGGIKAVVWTDVAQGVILSGGGLLILLRLLFAPEAGPPGAVVVEAWRMGRLTVGSWEISWRSLFESEERTLWLFLLAYLINWGRRYITDQHMVQRYLIARSDAEASRGAMMGALLCLPVFAIFMFAGACLAGFFSLVQDAGPALGDEAMPYFMMHYVPQGVLGLLVAALLAAAMSSVSSDLNSVSTVLTSDHFSLMFPGTSDAARLFFGRIAVLGGGLLAAWVAVLLIPREGTVPVIERTVVIASIISGGTLGLFALGLLSRTATRQGCYTGIACCIVFTAWAVLTEPGARMVDLGFNYPFDPILIGIGSQMVMFACGWLASRLLGGYRPENVEMLTLRGVPRQTA